jgi:hypothetical protein
MVQVIYTKEQGLKQQSGSALISLPDDVVITRPISQTVQGNTVLTLDFAALHHTQGGQAADEIDINDRYIIFKTPAATPATFYVWFNIAGGGADPFAGDNTKTAIPIAANAADVDSAAEIATLVANALTAVVAFDDELKAEADGSEVVITARRMGITGGFISDLSQFTNVTATDNSTVVSATQSYNTANVSGSHVLSELGVVKVKAAIIDDAKDSFVVVKDLPENTNFGARLIVLSELPSPVKIKSSDLTVLLADLDAAGDAAQLIWNGTAWKTLYQP